MMRVTQRAVVLTSLQGLNSNLSAVSKLQQQLTSGTQISRPSDSPTGTNTSLITRQAISGNGQYTRNISSQRFADLVARLLATGPEAAGLWERHEVEIPPREYPVRVRHPARGIIRADVALMPVYPRLWLYVMVLPDGIEPPSA